MVVDACRRCYLLCIRYLELWFTISIPDTYFNWIHFHFCISFVSAWCIWGADAKSLIVLSLILPSYPEISISGYDFPLNRPLPLFRDFFAFGIFENAVVLTIVVPLCLALYNISKMGLNIDKPLYIFIGYKTRISELSNKRHIKMIEGFEMINNRINFYFKRGGLELDDKVINDLKNFSEKSLIKDVWVTPGLPFMIPITLGFFVAAFYGDLITELTKYILFN